MDEQKFAIRFDGAGARKHVLGMRQLGESLIGVERLITVGLFAIELGRGPKRHEKLPFLVKASEPRQSSYEITVLLDAALPLLPLFHEFSPTVISNIVWRWVNWTLLKMGGRERDSNVHLEELIHIIKDVNAQRHIENLESQKIAMTAIKIVSPVGRSCDRMIFTKDDQVTEIDLPNAEAIRSCGKLEVGDMETFRIKVDGFTHHNRQLKVVLPDQPGRFVTGYIRDPAFDTSPNIYTDAATKEGWLKVTAKPTRNKQGMIQTLYIMDARAEDIEEQ